GEEVLAPELADRGPDADAGRQPQRLERPVHQLGWSDLARVDGPWHRGAHPRDDLLVPVAELVAVEGRRLDRAPPLLAAPDPPHACVVVAVALAAAEAHPEVLEEADHFRALLDVGGAALGGGGRPRVA